MYILDISALWCLINFFLTSLEFVLYFKKVSSQVPFTCSWSVITFSFSFRVWPWDCNKSLLLLSGLLLLMTCKVTSPASCTGNMHRSDSCSRADSAMARSWLELFQRMTRGRNARSWGWRTSEGLLKSKEGVSQACCWWIAVINKIRDYEPSKS